MSLTCGNWQRTLTNRIEALFFYSFRPGQIIGRANPKKLTCLSFKGVFVRVYERMQAFQRR